MFPFGGGSAQDPLDAYPIGSSVRFRSGASATLSRTMGTATNSKKWTWSGWVKKSVLGISQGLFGAKLGYSGTSRTLLKIDNGSNDIAWFEYDDINGYLSLLNTAIPVQRDPSAWYHIVMAYDSTQATASDRVKIYFNNQLLTWSGSPQYPALNQARDMNTAVGHYIGADGYDNASYLDGYVCEVNFIDGQALAPTDFAATNATTGQWRPKAYTGTYGTNGFYLKFNDGSNLTNLCLDRSGNGNNWTANNISLTAGVTYDWMTDTPTNNYCTLNPLSKGNSSISITDGNLAFSFAGASGYSAKGNIGAASGKWYWEVLVTNKTSQTVIGVIDINLANAADPISVSGAVGYYANSGVKYVNGSSSAYGASYTTNDVIGVALNMDAATVEFFKNNTSQGSISLGTSSLTYTAFGADENFLATALTFNFGQRPFAYTPPTGFVALCTKNLPVSGGTITTSGTFQGSLSADGPVVWLNGVPTAMTINGNAVTFGTHADKTAGGFKVRSSSSSYNNTGSNTYSVSTTGTKFRYSNAQGNP